MAARELQKHPRPQGAGVPGQLGACSGPDRVPRVPHSSRLDRLHLLHHRPRSPCTGAPHQQGLLRLLGVQDCWLLTLASEQDAQTTL
jgi:hypothetical protein